MNEAAPTIGLLGGTSFLHGGALADGDTKRVVTPFGGVDVVLAGPLAMIRRHGPEGNVPPHRINHHAHLWALRKLGVRGVVSVGSVGGLREAFSPGRLVLIDDIYAPHRTVSYHQNSMAITIPRFSTPWREAIREALSSHSCVYVDGGVYAEALGLRFESPAEIRVLAAAADVVGMTCASEATLAWELGLPVAVLASVDNWANGIGVEPLTDDAFHHTVRANRERVEAAVAAIATGLGG